MTTDPKGKSLDALTQELGVDDWLRLGHKGLTQPGKGLTKDAVMQALGGIESIANKPGESTEINEGEGTHILRIHDPALNVYYVTIVVNGVPMISMRDGKLDYDRIYDSEKEVLQGIVEAGMPEIQTFARKPGKKGKPAGKPQPKHRPGFAFDPALDRYLRENGKYFVFNALEGQDEGRKGKNIVSGEALEGLIAPDMLRRFREHGYDLSMQGIDAYVHESRKKIRELRRLWVSEEVQTEEVTGLVADFIREHQKDLLSLLKPAEKKDAYENARRVYKWFNQRKPGKPIQVIVDGLRYNLLQACSRTIVGEEFVKVRDATNKWLAYAVAGDFVETDPDIQREIIPIFKEKDEKTKNRDTNFEAVRLIGKKVVDPQHNYHPGNLKMGVRGLWIFGYIASDKTATKTGYGTEVEYIHPASHLLARYNVYDRVLAGAFNRALKARKDQPLTLETSLDCERFGRELYNAIDEGRRAGIFTSRRKGDMGAPLIEEGTHLGRILRMYVGINQERFLEKASQGR